MEAKAPGNQIIWGSQKVLTNEDLKNDHIEFLNEHSHGNLPTMLKLRCRLFDDMDEDLHYEVELRNSTTGKKSLHETNRFVWASNLNKGDQIEVVLLRKKSLHHPHSNYKIRFSHIRGSDGGDKTSSFRVEGGSSSSSSTADKDWPFKMILTKNDISGGSFHLPADGALLDMLDGKQQQDLRKGLSYELIDNDEAKNSGKCYAVQLIKELDGKYYLKQTFTLTKDRKLEAGEEIGLKILNKMGIINFSVRSRPQEIRVVWPLKKRLTADDLRCHTGKHCSFHLPPENVASLLGLKDQKDLDVLSEGMLLELVNNRTSKAYPVTLGKNSDGRMYLSCPIPFVEENGLRPGNEIGFRIEPKGSRSVKFDILHGSRAKGKSNT